MFNAEEHTFQHRRFDKDRGLINQVRIQLAHLIQSLGLGLHRLLAGLVVSALLLGSVLACLGAGGLPLGSPLDLRNRWSGRAITSPDVPGQEVEAAFVFIGGRSSLLGVAVVTALEAALLDGELLCSDAFLLKAAIERVEELRRHWQAAAVSAAVRGEGLQDPDLVARGPRALEQRRLPLGRRLRGTRGLGERRRRLPLVAPGRRRRARRRPLRRRRRLLASRRRGRHGGGGGAWGEAGDGNWNGLRGARDLIFQAGGIGKTRGRPAENNKCSVPRGRGTHFVQRARKSRTRALADIYYSTVYMIWPVSVG